MPQTENSNENSSKNFSSNQRRSRIFIGRFYNSQQPRNIFITYRHNRHNDGTCANLRNHSKLLLKSCSRSSHEISSLTPAKTQQFISFRYEKFHNNDNVVLICLRMKTSTQHKFNVLSTLNNFTGVIKWQKLCARNDAIKVSFFGSLFILQHQQLFQCQCCVCCLRMAKSWW